MRLGYKKCNDFFCIFAQKTASPVLFFCNYKEDKILKPAKICNFF